MQNVIEQSVLDNNWLPTAESSSHRHYAPEFPTVAVISALPQILLCNTRSLKLLLTIVMASYFILIGQGAR